MEFQFLKRTAAIGFLPALFLLSGCEKEIDIDLPTPELVLVVDGSIENNDFARVTVSRSIPYFDEINLSDPNSLQAIFVTDAVVILSDGVISDTLQFTIDPTQFPPVFYKGNNPLLKGEVGKEYFLTIYAEGDTLTSSTTIPDLISLDSVYWQPDGNKDSLGFGWARLDEPATPGNYYRMFAKRQEYAFYVSVGAYEDRLINGTVQTFTFVRPEPLPSYLQTGNPNENDDERFYYKKGDTISTRFCTIDEASFKFINTYEQAAQSFGNPFAAPTFVKSNIKGGFGGFVGYGATYNTYVVPE